MQYTEEDDYSSIQYTTSEPSPERRSNSRAVMDPKSIRQCKADQARILEQFNTPYYSILEFGAENMLIFEKIGKAAVEIISGSFIIDKWNQLLEALKEDSELYPQNDEEDTMTLNKMDVIQKQLDAIVAQMEKVKEENRRKSEELEMLRRTMAQHAQSSPVQDSSQQSQQNQQSYHTSEVVSISADAYDDYVMDFSKPAGYRPPPASADSVASAEPSEEERPRSTPRRRSLQPEAASNASSSRPPIPPPPRRQVGGDGNAGKHRSSRGGLKAGIPEMDRQRSQFLEEIRRSASERMQRKSGEEKQEREVAEKGSPMNRDVIVNGRADESEVTKNQRRLKMSLNDEIRQKMQERLKVMNESDEENLSNVD